MNSYGDALRKVYIGIDDTDNLESRGTGYRARCLCQELEHEGLAQIQAVTRHQLFVHKDIPYTSHNSSACLTVFSDRPVERLVSRAASFLEKDCADGSDPGLCVALDDAVTRAVIDFGRRAKQEVLRMSDAYDLAEAAAIHLSGHGGTKQGVIGALAAVALRHSGNDGRYIWAKGIREISGKLTAARILAESGVERILNAGAAEAEEVHQPADGDLVDVRDWFRPVLLDGKATLLVKPSRRTGPDGTQWEIVDRDVIKEKY